MFFFIVDVNQEDYLANVRKMSMKNSMDAKGIAINCKLELTKIEF
jgi:hypothetical protein